MGSDKNLEDLRVLLKDKNSSLIKASDVIEISFEKEEDADWFENIFQYYQRESAVCCLMSMRPKGKNATYKFVFNVKDMEKFIELLKEDIN